MILHFDLDILEQILKPLANSVADKIEVAQYLFDFNVFFRSWILKTPILKW